MWSLKDYSQGSTLMSGVSSYRGGLERQLSIPPCVDTEQALVGIEPTGTLITGFGAFKSVKKI